MAHSIRQARAQNPMWLYEHNYTTLCALFPGIVTGPAPCIEHDLEHSRLYIQIREKNKYTLLLEVTERFSQSPAWKQALNMRIRLYTDARLAEVVTYQGKARFQVKYEQPNAKMFHRDEKYQVNHLLYDWLLYLNRYLHRKCEEVTFP